MIDSSSRDIPSSRDLLWSLAKRYVPWLLLLGIIISGIVIFQMRTLQTTEINQRLNQRADEMASMLRSELESLRNQIRLIANNGLVVNSLVDVETRSSYIDPFFNTLDISELENEKIVLYDYKGQPIARNSEGSAGTLSRRTRRATIDNGGSLTITDRTFQMSLPVWVSGNIEGFLGIQGGEQSVDSLFEGPFSRRDSNDWLRFINPDGNYVWSNRPISDVEESKFVEFRNRSVPSTDLTLEYSENRQSLYGLMNSITWQFIILFISMLVLMVVGLVWFARQIIQPMTRLTEELDAKEARFRQMAENIDQAFYLAKPGFTSILYANPAVEFIFGVSPRELTEDSTTLKKYVNDEVADRLHQELKNHTFTGGGKLLEQFFTINHPERGLRHVQTKIHPITSNGEVERLVGIASDITEQKQLQDELEEQREFLRITIDAQPQLIFVKDWDGQYKLANEALAEIYQTDIEDIEGKQDSDFINDPDEIDAFREDDQEVMRSGEIKEIPEEPLTDPQEDITRWYYTLKVPMFTDRPPEERMVLGVGTEITKRRAVEKKLNEQKNRLELVKRAGDTGIWEYNNDTDELVWDDQMEEIFGRSADAYQDFLGCVHPEDRGRLNQSVQKSANTGEPFHEQYRIRKDGDGPQRWIDAHGSLQKSEGLPDKLVGSCRDITPRKRDEIFLQRLNEISSNQQLSYDEKIESVLQLGADFFDLPFGFVTHIHNEIQEIEYAYGHHDEIIPGASADLSRAYCQKTIEEDAPVFLHSTEQVRDVLGDVPYDTFGLSCYLGGKLNLDGDLHGTVCFADEEDRSDKTFDERDRDKLEIIIEWIQSHMERKRGIEQLETARQEAEAANEAKSRFLARMSHEIRTPLNAIMGMADLLSETELNEQQEHYVNVFQNSSEILLNLINDVLDISKIEAGELKLHESYFDIEELVMDTAEFFAEKAHGKGLELNAFVDPDCPPEVKTDKNRFRQVLVNLIGNALKFTDDGEVNVKLNVEDRDDETVTLRLEVQDTGEGISEEDQEAIFGEFAQTDESSTREQSGTGLGLSICESLATKMGGGIGVESELGQGSTFHVEVPLPYHDQPTSESLGRDIDLDQLEGRSVLVVDDNATNREILTKYFQSADVEVDTCINGEDTLDRLRGNPSYDMIFMDNQMPGLNGFDVIDDLPGEYKQDDVIMLTSDGMKTSREKAKQYDLAGYHIKPVARTKLLRIFSKKLSGDGEDDSTEISEAESTDEPEEIISGRLLLVEDDDNNRILVSSYLKQHDIEIDSAVNGEQALEHMKENKYDLVFMDLDMPVMDGFEATSKYREWEKQHRDGKMPVVALSAHAMEGSHNKAEESGCDDYLSKPILKDKLLDNVRFYLE